MKRIIIKILEKLFGRKICVVYRRLYDYTKNVDLSVCPFCNPENIIKEYDKFFVIKNKFAYPETEDHLLVTPKRHIVKYSELEAFELVELKYILDEWTKKGYLILGRVYGYHPEASIEHLHIHLIK